MKYSIIINQAGVIDAGLGEKTDLVDWAIIDYIIGWQTAPSAVRIGQHVWVNLKHLTGEMPLLGISTKGAVSKRLIKLYNLGLITKQKDDFGRLYVAISQFCHSITTFRAVSQTSEVFPTEPRGVSDGATGVFPAEPHRAVNPLSVNQEQKEAPPPIKPEWTPPQGLNIEAWELFTAHRKEINKPLKTDRTKTGQANKLKDLPPNQQMAVVNLSCDEGWVGLFPEKITAPQKHSNQPYQQNGSEFRPLVCDKTENTPPPPGLLDQLRGNV